MHLSVCVSIQDLGCVCVSVSIFLKHGGPGGERLQWRGAPPKRGQKGAVACMPPGFVGRECLGSPCSGFWPHH